MTAFIDAAVHLLALVALAAPLAAFQSAVPMTVAQGTNSGVIDSRQVVVRTTEEWRTLWASHGAAPAPAVDFARSVVVGIFLGNRPTAGFSVEITGATVQGDRAVVQFVEQRPDPDAMVAQVVTAPFHIVTLPSAIRTVRFQQDTGR